MKTCDSLFDMEMFGVKLPIVSLNHNAVLFMKGEKSAEAYLIVKGQVQLRRSGRSLQTAGPGCIVGAVELLDPQPRVISAVAVGKTEAGVIDSELFDRSCAEHRAFAMNVMILLARRLSDAEEKAASMDRFWDQRLGLARQRAAKLGMDAAGWRRLAPFRVAADTEN